MLRAKDVQIALVHRVYDREVQESLANFEIRVNRELGDIQEKGWDILEVKTHFTSSSESGDFEDFATEILYGVRIDIDPSS